QFPRVVDGLFFPGAMVPATADARAVRLYGVVAFDVAAALVTAGGLVGDQRRHRRSPPGRRTVRYTRTPGSRRFTREPDAVSTSAPAAASSSRTRRISAGSPISRTWTTPGAPACSPLRCSSAASACRYLGLPSRPRTSGSSPRHAHWATVAEV